MLLFIDTGFWACGAPRVGIKRVRLSYRAHVLIQSGLYDLRIGINHKTHMIGKMLDRNKIEHESHCTALRLGLSTDNRVVGAGACHVSDKKAYAADIISR